LKKFFVALKVILKFKTWLEGRFLGSKLKMTLKSILLLRKWRYYAAFYGVQKNPLFLGAIFEFGL